MQRYNCHRTGQFARACRSNKNEQVNGVNVNHGQSANYDKETHEKVFLGPIKTAFPEN